MQKSVCNDPIFGEMTYKHSWHRKYVIELLGNSIDIDLNVRAYSGKAITDTQRESFKQFESGKPFIDTTVTALLKGYVNDNLETLKANGWSTAKQVHSVSDLNTMVTPTSIVIDHDASILLLFECEWDAEHGLAVKVYPAPAIVGGQDTML